MTKLRIVLKHFDIWWRSTWLQCCRTQQSHLVFYFALVVFCVLNLIVVPYIVNVRCNIGTDFAVRKELSRESNQDVPHGKNLSLQYETAKYSFAFIFSTGRSGTKYMSRLFRSLQSPMPIAYITHQEEHPRLKTKDYVARYYRTLENIDSEQAFNVSALEFVKQRKIPVFQKLLAKHDASRLIYTGHLPLAFGLGPALLQALPSGTVRILRLRRDRLSAALSLMALGPELEDPWSESAFSANRRWFPGPTSGLVRLRVDIGVFKKMNRFQRWLWYVDDIECRWQALLADTSLKFEWMESSLESLEIMDNSRGWRRVADFLGVGLNYDILGHRDNSIEDKRREKADVSESLVRRWDAEYRSMVGICDLMGKGSDGYSWNDNGIN